MWLSVLVLWASGALADGVEHVELRIRPAPEAIVVDRYADFFDHTLMRRFGRNTMSGVDGLGGGDPRNLLGSAAAEAAADWSVWMLHKVPVPSVDLPLPSLKKSARTRLYTPVYTPYVPVESAGESDAQTPHPRRPRSPASYQASEPSLSLALTPRMIHTDEGQGVDAVFQATATGLGASAWRLSSKPLSKTWSVWMRQDLVRGFSLVATADSTPKKPKPSRFSGGALLRVPGESWRVFARYAHKLPKLETASEHQVAVTVSVVPDRKRHKR